MPDIWLTTSFITLVLFAGLQNVPGDLIEAARLDGARFPTLLFRIILPLLRPVIAVALIVRGIDAARAFDIILIQTNGGPQDVRNPQPADLPHDDPLRRSRPGQRHGHRLPDRDARGRRSSRSSPSGGQEGQLMSIANGIETDARSPGPRCRTFPNRTPMATARRRGVNREGLEAGQRSTRTLLWILLAAAMVLYGFPFLYLLLTSFKTPLDAIAVPPTSCRRSGRSTTTSPRWASKASSGLLINSVADRSAQYCVLTRPRGAGGVRDHPLQDAERPGLRDRGAGHPDGADDRGRHPAGSIDAAARHLGHPDRPGDRPHHDLAAAVDLADVELLRGGPDRAGRSRQGRRLQPAGALWQVVLPVVSGGFAVTAIFAFLASWNEFLFALLLTPCGPRPRRS